MKPIPIAPNGLCECGNTECPLGKVGMQNRCTERQLQDKDIPTTRPRGWECDFCLKIVTNLYDVHQSVHFKFGWVTLCGDCWKKHINRVR